MVFLFCFAKDIYQTRNNDKLRTLLCRTILGNLFFKNTSVTVWNSFYLCQDTKNTDFLLGRYSLVYWIELGKKKLLTNVSVRDPKKRYYLASQARNCNSLNLSYPKKIRIKFVRHLTTPLLMLKQILIA